MSPRTACFAVVLTACSVESDAPPLTSEAEGTYSISAWTEGDDCSLADTLVDASTVFTTAMIEVQDTFVGEALVVVMCAEPSSCRAALDGENSQGSILWFTDGDDETGWTATTTVFGNDIETGACEARTEDHRLVLVEPGVVQLETRASEEATFAEDAEGYCTSDDAKDALGDAPPCEHLTVVALTR